MAVRRGGRLAVPIVVTVVGLGILIQGSLLSSEDESGGPDGGRAQVAATSTGPPDGSQAPTTVGTATTTSVAKCESGGRSRTLGGVRVRQFCGPAVAEVRAGEETLKFGSGECARHEDWLALNLGFEIIDSEPGDAFIDPEFRSFTLLMGRHPLAPAEAPPAGADGVFTEAVLTFAVPGQSYILEDKTVTLAGTRMVGTFVGTGFRGTGHEPIPIMGTFTCDASTIPLEQVQALVKTVATGPQ